MGISENINFTSEEWVLDLKSRSVLMVLSEAEMTNARLDAVDMPQQMQLLMLQPDAEIPPAQLEQASLLVLEIRPDLPGSLQRFEAVRQIYPELPVIAAIRNADLPMVRTLLKKGVRDVAGLPLSHSELAAVVKEICEELDRRGTKDVQQGQLVSVLKSIGGVGATTVATHLASELASKNLGRGVCLIDLDLQFGNAAAYLGLSAHLSIADLIAAGSRIDGALLKSVASKTDNGLNVVAAPLDIVPIESVNADQIMRIIDLARAEYDHVVLDLPTNWTNWTLSLVAASDAIFLVAELSVASLRQAKRQLHLLESQNISGQHINVIANRVEKRLFRTIDLNSAAQALGHPIKLSIHNDYPLVRAAHDQGVLIREIRAKSKIAGDIENLLPCLGVDAGN